MELVNRITVKKVGYMYRQGTVRNRRLTVLITVRCLRRVYEDGGQRALDQKIFEMINEMDIEMRGNHASVRRYEEARKVLKGWRYETHIG